jgi:hypothetical protein
MPNRLRESMIENLREERRPGNVSIVLGQEIGKEYIKRKIVTAGEEWERVRPRFLTQRIIRSLMIKLVIRRKRLGNRPAYVQ